ncbi:MAG: N-6 DNA methylase [Bacteroidetes bacterium]|nr:N-6 DNA methylase [Bacteroidota bacterium]
MDITFEDAFLKVKVLVAGFQANESYFLSAGYDESTTRQRFIDPFWTAMGWNLMERDPYKQKVRIEDTVTEGKKQKRADYAFYISPDYRTPRFITEAKKPSKNLYNPEDYFQTVRYGFFSGIPVAVLFDFEELHILDCRGENKPVKKDVLKRKLESYHYTDFADAEKFKKIFNLFSRGAVANGSIENYIRQYKRPYKRVDEILLDELDGIRDKLARSLKKRNPALESEPLTEAVQRIINRLVLFRFLEDKLIEQEYYVGTFSKSGTAWIDFITECSRMDAKYNGIIFRKHFIDEPGFKSPEPDIFCEVCSQLSHLNQEGYDFDLIPIPILGSIYERFLGKVVHATEKRVKVEEKGEVRKAEGVYYTPQYIVNYIVENTIGSLIRGKTPKEISSFRFADIACGSGSFLIGIYDYLLEYHKQWYTSHQDDAGQIGCTITGDKIFLPLQLRKNILINNIFGVDIDNQAVEVTQLSLYLKLLEENGMYMQQLLFKEKILPDLSKNIVCGNSLVERDINGNLFGETDEIKINPMNMKSVFPEGFDAIIGNPPWGQKAVEFNDEVKIYFKQKYPAAADGILDLFRLFVERAISLLKNNGYFGQVLPDIVLLKNYKSTRRYILDKINISNIDHWGMVFEGVNLECCTIIGKAGNINPAKIVTAAVHEDKNIIVNHIPQSAFLNLEGFKFNLYINPGIQLVLEQLQKHKKLSNFVSPHEGIHSGNIRHKLFIDKKKNKNCKKLIFGRDEVKRYYLIWQGKWVNYALDTIDRRKKEYAGLGKKEFYEIPKLVVRRTGDYVLANVDYEKYYFSNNVFVCPQKESNNLNLKYILGILNSKLITWYYRTVQPRKGKLFSELKINVLGNIPIRDINFANPSEKSLHDKIVKLVDEMLSAKKQFINAKTDKDKLYYERKCNETDNEIDSLVFLIYDVNPKDLNI